MKALIFDAFGTLFDVEQGGSAKAVMANITAHKIPVDKNEFIKEWKAFYKTYTAQNCKFMTEREIFILRIQMFYDKYGVKRNAQSDAEYLIKKAFMRKAFSETKTVIEKLMRCFKVFIGSNTDNDVLEAVMKNNGISVHKAYTSEDLKCYKPSPDFYYRILKENNLNPQDVLFVGDSLTDDVIGPKSVGMKTALVDRAKRSSFAEQDYTFTELTDLLKITEL